ncbi:MAG: TonB-dependent receptor [Bacteroidota bacterium]
MMMLLVWSLVPLASWAQFTVSGKVVTKQDELPITNAEIALVEAGKLVFANQAGVFEVQDIPEGVYTVQVKALDYLTFVRKVKIVANTDLTFKLIPTIGLSEEVLITATRASEKTATTYSEMDKEAIDKVNYGQDLPFILSQLPGTVVTSDAGAGIGYTGIRIRGSDPTRTNVTINGIPLNDAESHGVFWVNLPDFASSVDNIQVQRGVGTSTNGAAAFGATINLQTNTISYEPYATSDNTYGSFNTWKNTLRVGTGLIDGKFSVDARLSRINSDGWVDRASSNLRSFFISGNYYGKKQLLKFNAFTGREITYQSWYGVPEALINGGPGDLDAFIDRNFVGAEDAANLRSAGRQYNFYTYDNEVDNYQQRHYQLMYAAQPTAAWNLNLALHYTQGEGFFEQFRIDDDLADYGLPNVQVGNETVTASDLIRRRWLDNDFYGAIYSAQYQPTENFQLTLGGGFNRYDGDHFGEIVWARFASTSEIRDRYYDNRGLKDDFNTYLKGTAEIANGLIAYADLQVRTINYELGNADLNGPGNDNDQAPVEGDFDYSFFNPKFGLTYQLSTNQNIYASYSISNREPVRSDLIDAPDGRTPEHETLYDLEAGYRLQNDKFQFQATYYWMDYNNQLVLTGELNDVGANVRQNVSDSYRTGLELSAAWLPTPKLRIAGNLAYSVNKIKVAEEIFSDFDNGGLVINRFEDSDISFSPDWVGGYTVSYAPIRGLEISAIGKYVGDQFLDNTSNESRKLDAFYNQDVNIIYTIKPSWAKEIQLGLLLKNVFDAEFEPNGYTFSYKAGGQVITENFFYPQAGTYALGRLSITL